MCPEPSLGCGLTGADLEEEMGKQTPPGPAGSPVPSQPGLQDRASGSEAPCLMDGLSLKCWQPPQVPPSRLPPETLSGTRRDIG